MLLTRLCVAAGGAAVASLSSTNKHLVHAATTPESVGVKSETKGDTKGDTKAVKDTKTSKAGEAASGAKKTKATVKASELPIYGDPAPVTFDLLEEKKPSAYFTAVSDARKFVWTYGDSVKSATSKVCDAYETTKKTTKDGLHYIQKDSGVVPRAVVISVAGLGGIVAGYRGGFFRKTLYASIAMAGAASLCYPDQAASISKKGWRTVRDFTSQAYKDNVSSVQGSKVIVHHPPLPSPLKTPPPASPQPIRTKLPPSTDIVEETAAVAVVKPEDRKSATTLPSKGDHPPVKKDFGMSKPEDKDMYSTRGAK